MLTPLERETQAAILLRENIIAELGPDEQLIADSTSRHETRAFTRSSPHLTRGKAP